MSCQAQTTTRWVESASVYESTQHETYMTTSTVTPHPIETSVVQSWCGTPDATSSESPSTPTPPASTSALDSIVKTLDAGAGRLTIPTRSLSSVSEAPSFSPAKPVESTADNLRRALIGEHGPSSDCTWTTTTHWTMIYPDPTRSVFEVTATNTVWNTVQTLVPSVTVQECAQTATATATQDFWTESSGWVLASSEGSMADPTVTAATDFTWMGGSPMYGVPQSSSYSDYTFLLASQGPPTTTPSGTAIGPSTTTGIPNASPVKLHDTAVLASMQSVTSPSRVSQQAVATASANSSTTPNQAMTSKGPSSAAVVGWACGTIGILAALGLFAWFYFQRRKRQEERARYDNRSNAHEKGSFLDDFSDEDGGSETYQGNTFKQVVLDTDEKIGTNKVRQTKQAQPGSRFSAMSSVRNLYGLSSPVAKALIRPLSFFGQIVPAKRVLLDANPSDAQSKIYLPPISTPSDPSPASVIPRPYGPQHHRDSSGKDSYHYRKRSYVETPIQSPFGTPFATMAGFGLAERVDKDQCPTDLSPHTQKLLIDAMARPISAVTDRPALPFPLTPDVLYQLPRHVLSVNSVYLEPEIETVDDGRRHTYHSGWYRRSILKGLFPVNK